MILLFFYVVLIALAAGNHVITRPKQFYGSDALLDGYCDDAQYFIDVFTLPTDPLTVEGLPSEVNYTLATISNTGKLVHMYYFNYVSVRCDRNTHMHIKLK